MNLGNFDGRNPVIGAIVPQAPESEETYDYSLEEIPVMLSVLSNPARAMVATVVFTESGEVK